MSLTGLLSTPCTVHLRAAARDSGDDVVRDRYNNPVLEDVDLELRGHFEQKSASEDRVDTEAGAEEWLVMLPATYVADADSDTYLELPLDNVAGVTVGELELELIGPPWPVNNPRLRRVSHLEARGRRVV